MARNACFTIAAMIMVASSPALSAAPTAAPGKPMAAGDGGDLAIDPGKLILRDRSGSVRWDITLAPDEQKKLTYQYDRYVPSN